MKEEISTFVQRKIVDGDSGVVGEDSRLIVPRDVGKGVALGYAGEENRVADGDGRALRSNDNLCRLSWEECVIERERGGESDASTPTWLVMHTSS